MKRIKQNLELFVAVVALAIVSAGQLRGQELPDWVNRMKISGLAFGDAYAVAGNHDAALEGANGFWLRRLYLTFDNQLSSDLRFRVRFEANSPGDFTTSAKMTPAIKDLYVRWSGENNDVYLGLSGTPIWGTVEGFWGYRDVEKTPLDLQKFGSSRDFGVALKGRTGNNGSIRYHAQIGNGNSNKSETNEEKKFAFSLGYHGENGFILEAYADYDLRPGETNRNTFQGFLGYSTDQARFGVLGATQHRQVAGTDGTDLAIVSGFGVYQVNERVSLLARYDHMFDPNPSAGGISYLPMSPDANSNLILAGVDYAIDSRFHLIPNIEAVFYDSSTLPVTPDADIMGRVTFSVKF